VIKRFFELIFTWWNRETFGTQLWTWAIGEFVGEDEFGNRYYRRRGGKIDPTLGFDRRWVAYNGYAEPSTVPPEWHGWLHHTGALRPTGSTLALGRRPRATGDYKAWTPGE
jgi:NADH:ubiquinone oxidoreductase subunit